MSLFSYKDSHGEAFLSFLTSILGQGEEIFKINFPRRLEKGEMSPATASGWGLLKQRNSLSHNSGG